jgi:hypothetical protein
MMVYLDPLLLVCYMCVCMCVSPSACRVCELPARCEPGVRNPPILAIYANCPQYPAVRSK